MKTIKKLFTSTNKNKQTKNVKKYIIELQPILIVPISKGSVIFLYNNCEGHPSPSKNKEY